jgi:hypothetical protein
MPAGRSKHKNIHIAKGCCTATNIKSTVIQCCDTEPHPSIVPEDPCGSPQLQPTVALHHQPHFLRLQQRHIKILIQLLVYKSAPKIISRAARCFRASENVNCSVRQSGALLQRRHVRQILPMLYVSLLVKGMG